MLGRGTGKEEIERKIEREKERTGLEYPVPPIEIDTLEYQQTEKIETELKDVDRIRIRKCTPAVQGAWHSGGS